MSRVLILVEGRTEETFVQEVLAPYLEGRGYHSVRARILGRARQRSRRGGIRPWPQVKSNIVGHLLEDRTRGVSTMVDYYGLPSRGPGAWPGRAETIESGPGKAENVESAMSSEVHRRAPRAARRFIPYVSMHEFESLLFSDCGRLAHEIGRAELAPKLENIRAGFDTPEGIDDRPDGAPSKRLVRLFDEYDKPLHGNLAALGIGIEAMRRECPHFADWIERLEGAARR